MSRLAEVFLKALSHNDNHFFRIRFRGEEYPICTRCGGMCVGFVTTAPLVIALGAHRAPGYSLAALALILFLPDFGYWAATRVRALADINAVRIGTGFLLGAAIGLYGQAAVPWGWKLSIPALLFAMVFLANPILGRRRGRFASDD